jgi:hypothetical protein
MATYLFIFYSNITGLSTQDRNSKHAAPCLSCLRLIYQPDQDKAYSPEFFQFFRVEIPQKRPHSSKSSVEREKHPLNSILHNAPEG